MRILSGDAGAVSVLQRIVDACANDNPEAECLSCMDDWYVACGGTVCVLRLGWHVTCGCGGSRLGRDVWVCTGPSWALQLRSAQPCLLTPTSTSPRVLARILVRVCCMLVWVAGCTCTPLMLVMRAGQAFINKASDMQICAGAAPNSDHLCSTCWPLAQDARVLYVRCRDGMAQFVYSLAALAGGNPVRTHPVMSR